MNRFESNKEKEAPKNQNGTSPVIPASANPNPQRRRIPASDHQTKAYLVIVKGLATPDKSDQLKAQLLLSGYDVKFEPVNLAGQKFNRIILGPFKSKDEAEQAKAALSGQALSAEIRGLKVEQ